tara:strand:+ start:93 stop:209 length:117 start_codon:yes stop_codon:yes gene_type:complete
MGWNEIMSEDVEKKKETSDEGREGKKKVKIYIVCCTIM